MEQEAIAMVAAGLMPQLRAQHLAFGLVEHYQLKGREQAAAERKAVDLAAELLPLEGPSGLAVVRR